MKNGEFVGSWTRIRSWAEIVVLPERQIMGNDGHFPECASSIHCLRECVQSTGMRTTLRRGVNGGQLEAEFEESAGMCVLMLAAVEKAREMHQRWKRVAGGKEGRGEIKKMADYLEMVAEHGRVDGRNMKSIAAVANDLNPRRRRKGDEDDEVE